MSLENQKFLAPGLKDSDFIRGEVPMTKEEVRTISISKLRLTENSLVYDIGGGTGSVSIEIARLSQNISVFTIESQADAVELINQNVEKFNCKNITVIHSLAPEGFEKLPVPTHAFIGGTKGNLLPILKSLYKKNPQIRIVINAVTLESIASIQETLKEFPITDDEITQISVSKARKTGTYHMMQANNPVFVFSFTFDKTTEREQP